MQGQAIEGKYVMPDHCAGDHSVTIEKQLLTTIALEDH